VALTRVRNATHLFVAREDVRDVGELSAQMQRQAHRGASVGLEAIERSLDHEREGKQRDQERE
jgi:hypothetical protein